MFKMPGGGLWRDRRSVDPEFWRQLLLLESVAGADRERARRELIKTLGAHWDDFVYVLPLLSGTQFAEILRLLRDNWDISSYDMSLALQGDETARLLKAMTLLRVAPPEAVRRVGEAPLERMLDSPSPTLRYYAADLLRLTVIGAECRRRLRELAMGDLSVETRAAAAVAVAENAQPGSDDAQLPYRVQWQGEESLDRVEAAGIILGYMERHPSAASVVAALSLIDGASLEARDPTHPQRPYDQVGSIAGKLLALNPHADRATLLSLMEGSESREVRTVLTAILWSRGSAESEIVGSGIVARWLYDARSPSRALAAFLTGLRSGTLDPQIAQVLLLIADSEVAAEALAAAGALVKRVAWAPYDVATWMKRAKLGSSALERVALEVHRLNRKAWKEVVAVGDDPGVPVWRRKAIKRAQQQARE